MVTATNAEISSQNAVRASAEAVRTASALPGIIWESFDKGKAKGYYKGHEEGFAKGKGARENCIRRDPKTQTHSDGHFVKLTCLMYI